MANKLDNLLASYQGNAYPAMLDHLADQLGLAVEPLSQIGLGWAPIVNFKNGPNFHGWWVIPERDADGQTVGLSLRSQTGHKVMFPGSKHGLIYAPNPAHIRGSVEYRHGAHNWARIADAGVDCPVCGKPDGCMVSSEDPDDPKAAICIRQREGASKPMNFGYLHILKPEGKVQRGATLLPPSDKPVVVVEGMTDAATAMGLGFVAVGRPSNLACMDMLTNLLRGRPVIVVGENDDINPLTGRRAGEEGMVAAFQVLKLVCPDIRMVLPPEHVKDLREWVTRFDLTADGLIEYATANGRERSEQTVLPDAKPLTMARAWLDAENRMASRYTLRYYREQWYSYCGSKYTIANEEVDIRGRLYGWADDKHMLNETPNGKQTVTPVICTRATVNNVLDALLNLCPVPADNAPCWVNGATGPDPKDLIPFTNGLLWLPKYLAGAPEEEYLLEPTPDFFTTFCLPFPFDPTARCPRWHQFCIETLGDEPGKINLMREWFGYCLTSDTSLHKMMIMRGPSRSGKSTAHSVLQAIVGQEQCANPSLASLSGPFGLEDLVGKQLIVMGDARLPKGGDSTRALEILLNIVGEDEVNVARKFKSALNHYKFRTHVTIGTNELPDLPDHAGAMEQRLLILDFRKVFTGREDFDLKQKLAAEAPGIVLWALAGLRRLQERGRFELPDSTRRSLRDWRTSTSPTAAFLEECCDDDDPEAEVSKPALYDAWSQWSRERGMLAVPRTRFYERIRSNAPFVVSDCYEKGGHKLSVFRGLKMKKWAAKQYLGKIN